MDTRGIKLNFILKRHFLLMVDLEQIKSLVF